MSGFFNGSATVKKYLMTFLLALLIAVVFYVSANLINLNPIEYAAGFVFGLVLTLIFQQQSNNFNSAKYLERLAGTSNRLAALENKVEYVALSAGTAISTANAAITKADLSMDDVETLIQEAIKRSIENDMRQGGLLSK
ncbi:TPA: hypothetical protein ACNH5N_003127 [Acinetobacter baumannii]